MVATVGPAGAADDVFDVDEDDVFDEDDDIDVESVDDTEDNDVIVEVDNVVETGLDEDDSIDEDVVLPRLPHVAAKSPVFLKLSAKVPTEMSNLVF